MSIKKLLYLDKAHISEEEIIRKIDSAMKKHIHEVIFKKNGESVKIKLTDVEPKGIMPRSYNHSNNAS
ncbi:hypothetical protein HOC32_02715 [Candidatus Woesearchaeota archaeon]|jgi:hypothetical protein|nr:hypothetical protein [Candidatus Woesearchaeota archaeon]